MSNLERITKSSVIRYIVTSSDPISDSTRRSHSSFRAADAFTIIELLVVIAIIIILGSLILSTVGYVQKKGVRSRAEAEIAAMSAALESYKADNGIYPRDSASTDQLDARVHFHADPKCDDPQYFT